MEWSSKSKGVCTAAAPSAIQSHGGYSSVVNLVPREAHLIYVRELK